MKRQQGKVKEVEKTWLSAREAKAYLDCSDDFLQMLRDEARVSFSRVGGKYFYNLESIDRLLIKNKII